MSEVCEVVEPTQELIAALANNLSKNDIKDCIARGFKTPQDALKTVFDSGELLAVGCVDKRPLVAVGCAPTTFLNPMINEGFMWVMMSDEARQYPKAIVQLSKRIISNLLEYYHVLVSQVQDERSLRYDKFLGFRETGIEVNKDGINHKILINYGIRPA